MALPRELSYGSPKGHLALPSEVSYGSLKGRLALLREFIALANERTTIVVVHLLAVYPDNLKVKDPLSLTVMHGTLFIKI